MKYLSIQRNGLNISPDQGRKMFHPLKRDYQSAIWAFSEASPQHWIKNTAHIQFDLPCLFGHCAAGDTLVLLELDLPRDADLWVTDWRYGMKDETSREYYAALRPYKDADDIGDFLLPEVICFDNVDASLIRPIDIPLTVVPHVRPIDLETPAY